MLIKKQILLFDTQDKYEYRVENMHLDIQAYRFKIHFRKQLTNSV